MSLLFRRTTPQNIPSIAESPNQNYKMPKEFVNNNLGIVLPRTMPFDIKIMQFWFGLFIVAKNSICVNEKAATSNIGFFELLLV